MDLSKKTNFKLFNINKNFRFFRRKTTIKYVIVGGYESKAFLPANFPQKHKLHRTFFRTRMTYMRFALSTSIQNFYKRTTLKQHSKTFVKYLRASIKNFEPLLSKIANNTCFWRASQASRLKCLECRIHALSYRLVQSSTHNCRFIRLNFLLKHNFFIRNTYICWSALSETLFKHKFVRLLREFLLRSSKFVA